MAALEILTWPDPRLGRVSEPVTRFDAALRGFIRDLEATMRAGPGAVGIAAPQVDCHQRIVIVDVSARPKVDHHGRLVLVNPEIGARDGAAAAREGCLSVPDYTGNVVRAERIRLQAQDEHGRYFSLSAQGYEARAIQHEIDHLDGILFLDRLVSRRNDLFRRQQYG